MNRNVVYQDNPSAMKLEYNGKERNGKRTKHFHIKLFYMTDLIKRNEMVVDYCSTNNMIADFFTKSLLGDKFKKFRSSIMNSE